MEHWPEWREQLNAGKLDMLSVISAVFLGNRFFCRSFRNRQNCTQVNMVPDLYYTSLNLNKSAGHRKWEPEWEKWCKWCSCMCIMWYLKSLRIPSQLTRCHSRKTQVFLICQPHIGVSGTVRYLKWHPQSVFRQVNWTQAVQTEHIIPVVLFHLPLQRLELTVFRSHVTFPFLPSALSCYGGMK